MNTSVNRKQNNEAELVIEVTNDEFRPFLEQAAAKLSSQTTIPGFRVGHAPYDMVRDRVGEMKIYEEALEPMVNKTFRDAIKQHDLNPVGLPKIQITKIAVGSPVAYKATIALLPAVTVCAYEKIKVPRKEIAVTQDEVAKTIDELCAARASEALVNRAAAQKDRVHMNIAMFLDAVPLEGGQAKDAVLELGKEWYVPGFDAEIVGLLSGQKKDFTLRFPDKHGDRRLAGKDVEFRVEVNGVYEVKKPEPNDDFAKSLGAFANFEELKKKIQENITMEKTHREEERRESEMLKQFVEKSEFGPIPDLLIDAEIDKMMAELEDMVEHQGAKFADYLVSIKKTADDLKKEFRVPARRRVETSLLIREVAKNEQIAVEEKEIEAELQRLRAYYKDAKETIDHLDHQHTRDWIRGSLLNKKVSDFLQKKVLKE